MLLPSLVAIAVVLALALLARAHAPQEAPSCPRRGSAKLHRVARTRRPSARWGALSSVEERRTSYGSLTVRGPPALVPPRRCRPVAHRERSRGSRTGVAGVLVTRTSCDLET